MTRTKINEVKMTRINFTQEQLTKININNFIKYLNKKGIEVKHHKRQYSQMMPTFNDHYQILVNKDFSFRIRIDSADRLLWLVYSPIQQCGNELTDIIIWQHLVKHLYPSYVMGDLTEFHRLFNEIYEEIQNEV